MLESESVGGIRDAGKCYSSKITQSSSPSARFIADPEFAAGIRFPEPGKHLLQSVQIVANAAVKSALSLVAGNEAEGDALRVDIESKDE